MTVLDAVSLAEAEGHKSPHEIAICMGFDAMRIALTGQPKNYSVKQVLAWLTDAAAPETAKSTDTQPDPISLLEKVTSAAVANKEAAVVLIAELESQLSARDQTIADLRRQVEEGRLLLQRARYSLELFAGADLAYKSKEPALAGQLANEIQSWLTSSVEGKDG